MLCVTVQSTLGRHSCDIGGFRIGSRSSIGIGIGSIGFVSAGFGLSIDLVLQCSALRDMRERRPWNWFSPTPPSPTSSGAQGESKGSRERGGHNWSQLYHFATSTLLQAH